ncbi:MAG: SLC13 family permease, partial [Promethearchaeota archaeon]
MISTIIAPMMLVLIIILIIVGKMNRLMAAFIGAIIVAFFLLYIDKIDMAIVVGFIFGVDNSNFHTILFIFGMMIIISVCKINGVFNYIAFRLVQLSKGKSSSILIILCGFTFIFSSFSMNILCIFLVIPITITICKMLRINPIPFILSEGMVVNTGGLLFVISSIPNILISRSINWTFVEYFQDVGFFSLYLIFISVIFLVKYNEKKLETPETNHIKRLLDYDPWMFVESKSKFYKSFAMLI